MKHFNILRSIVLVVLTLILTACELKPQPDYTIHDIDLVKRSVYLRTLNPPTNELLRKQDILGAYLSKMARSKCDPTTAVVTQGMVVFNQAGYFVIDKVRGDKRWRFTKQGPLPLTGPFATTGICYF